MLRPSWLVSIPALLLIVSVSLGGQNRGGTAGAPTTGKGDWPHYTADMRGTKYSPLDQISSPVRPSSATIERRVPAVV